MHSMTQEPRLVIGRVDAHTDAHHVARWTSVVCRTGTASFPANSDEHAEARRWLEDHGRVEAVKVESTGSYAAGMARYLRENCARNCESGMRNGFRPRKVQTAEGELEIEIPQVREAAQTFARVCSRAGSNCCAPSRSKRW